MYPGGRGVGGDLTDTGVWYESRTGVCLGSLGEADDGSQTEL